MKSLRNRIISIIIITMMIVAGLPVSYLAYDFSLVGHAADDIASGNYRNLDWRIKSDGELVIGKAGQTQIFSTNSSYADYPWLVYTEKIHSVSIEGKVVGAGKFDFLFVGFSNLTNVDLSGFDASKVTDMGFMFHGCSSLTNVDLSGFDTSNVTNMEGIFSECSSLKSLDLSDFDTSNVTGMSHMFNGCSSLTSLDLSSFDTSSVTDMVSMFWGCSSLKSLDLSNFDTTNVTDMAYMFRGCSSLTSLDLSSFDTLNVTDMALMLDKCSGLNRLSAPKNVKLTCQLPCTMYDPAGTQYTSLPIGLDHSITLYRDSQQNEEYFVLGKDNNSFVHNKFHFFNFKRFVFKTTNNDYIDVVKSWGYSDKIVIDPNEYEAILIGPTKYLTLGLRYSLDLYGTNNNEKKTTVYEKGCFHEVSDPEGFRCTTCYYDELAKGSGFFEKLLLSTQANKKWEGSCFGIEYASIMASENRLTNIFGNNSFYSLGLPRDNKYHLRDVINYYQLLQNKRDCKPDYRLKSTAKSTKKKEFLEALVKEAQKSKSERKPFILSFSYKYDGETEGHAVVVCGYCFDSTTNEHVIKISDCNDGGSYADHYRDFRVSSDYSSFKFTDANGEYENIWINDVYKDMEILGIDTLSKVETIALPDTSSSKRNLKALQNANNDNKVQLILSAYKNCKVINDAGETLLYDGTDYSGSMTVYDEKTIISTENVLIKLEVDPSNAYTITNIDKDKEFTAIAEIDGNYYGVDEKNAESIVLANTGVVLDGEKYDYSITQGEDGNNISGVNVTGVGTGKVNTDFDETFDMELSNSSEYIAVTLFKDDETDSTIVEENVDRIEISPETGEIVDKEIVLKDVNDYSIESIEKQTYTGEAITPEIVLGDGYKVLIKDRDYKLEYRNNTNIGTATIIITGIGNYKGTIETSFDIVDAGTSEGSCAHIWGAWTIAKKATEIAAGEQSRTCFVCGETETQVIEQLKPTLSSIKISKLTAGKKSATVKWKKLSKKKLKKISKIQIQYSTSKDFSKNVKTKYASAKKTSYKIKSLKKGKRYYIRIRAYKKTNGVVHVSKWSKARYVKAK